jgi:hypothetical protein
MAVLIMHHNLVEQDLGSNNAIATTLKQAARAARITDNRFDIDTAPEVILCKWSDMIKAEFIRLNHSIPEVAADGSHLATVINQQSQIILSQHQTITSIKSKIDMLVRQKSVAPKRLATIFEQGGGAIGEKKAKTGSTADVTIAVLIVVYFVIAWQTRTFGKVGKYQPP